MVEHGFLIVGVRNALLYMVIGVYILMFVWVLVLILPGGHVGVPAIVQGVHHLLLLKVVRFLLRHLSLHVFRLRVLFQWHVVLYYILLHSLEKIRFILEYDL